MLVKKLKRLGKACRKADDPVLLTLAACVDHVADYLQRAEDDTVITRDYGEALARLDLSAVVKAREALGEAEPATEQQALEADQPAEPPAETSTDDVPKKGKKKGKKGNRK